MPGLLKTLRSSLPETGRIAILAVGSDQRGDDAAGLIAGRHLQRLVKGSRRAKVFIGETAPENLTGDIRRYAPRHLVVIDACSSGGRPGAVHIASDRELDGPGLTHRLPLRILLDYLRAEVGCTATVVLIEVRSWEFGASVSAAVRRAAERVARALGTAVVARHF